ncbi:MAG: carbohydrate ABC transporter substrate-binding protein [Lachnospiraceae bacterium]|nr:carbohydrate ABC transporter substrate-binding protein [Lachnospiraceae bacterium]
MNQKRWKRMTAWILMGILLLMSGCSGKGGTDIPKETKPEGGEPATETQMGRYLEEEIELPKEALGSRGSWEGASLKQLESGELALLNVSGGFFVSSDQGTTWERREMPALDKLTEENYYVPGQAIAPDGSVAIIYAGGDEEEEAEEEEEAGKYRPKYLYLDGEGKEHPIQYTDKENYLTEFAFGRDSRLYAFSSGGSVYEISREDGTARQIFETDGTADYICFTETYLTAATSGGFVVYNLETESLEEDPVIQEFLSENVGGAIGAVTGSHPVVMAAGPEKDTIYLALDKGLFRHVIGGTVIEQVADGALNSLGDPQMSLLSMEVFSDEALVILYNEIQLYRYVYDPNLPAVPEEQISIYSLEEDYTIRQAVSLYQKKNPGVYIRYEVGMSGDDGVTREDAIKNLNTRMLSGNGPDLLVLDGLPEKSYREKGILADLTETEKELTGEHALFSNLVDACRTEGALYSLPVRFQIPLLVGETEDLKSITDLASLADAVEKLRAEYPEGGITSIPMEELILGNLGLACRGAWTDEKGDLDTKALTEFLTQAKRIYEAELAGYNETELQMYQERIQKLRQEGDVLRYYMNVGSQAISIAMGELHMGTGVVSDMKSDFNTLTSVMEQMEGLDFNLCPGQEEASFIPVARVGIFAQSMEKEQARSFFQFLFGPELQNMDLGSGFPVNQASFEKMKEEPEEGESGGSYSISSSNGEGGIGFSLNVVWASPEQFERLKEIVNSLKTAGVSDSVIENNVYETGVKVLNGTMEVKDAVDEIVKKAAIYLAE